MARPLSAVFTVNGAGPSEFKLPDVHAADPLNVALFPTLDYFERPNDMVRGQKITMRLNPEAEFFGQVYGYVAPKGQCILDLDGPDSCWMVPPSPTGYEWAHQGKTILADATDLPTANIGGGGGHAPHELGWQAVPRYYEDIDTQMARVRYGEDDFGVYAVGIAVPTMTWGGALMMVASATSGDWRWVDELSAWDFMGSCFVNLPGLPLHAKSGTRKVRSASATPSPDHQTMIVTMAADVAAPDTEDEDMSAANGKPCNCTSAAEAAAQAAGAEPVTTTTPGLTPEEVDERIASALTARDAEWETKVADLISGAVSPITERLSSVEEISISVLDRA